MVKRDGRTSAERPWWWETSSARTHEGVDGEVESVKAHDGHPNRSVLGLLPPLGIPISFLAKIHVGVIVTPTTHEAEQVGDASSQRLREGKRESREHHDGRREDDPEPTPIL